MHLYVHNFVSCIAFPFPFIMTFYFFDLFFFVFISCLSLMSTPLFDVYVLFRIFSELLILYFLLSINNIFLYLICIFFTHLHTFK